MDRTITVLIVSLWACASLSAQWLQYSTAGIPRTPDGKPDLTAPAPKTADGKPDLSGIWQWEHKPGPGRSPFSRIGENIKDPLPYQPAAAALVKGRRERANGPEEPLSNCLPMGPVEKDTIDNTLWKIVQIPGLILQLNEWNTTYRQIFTDGRSFPADMQPAWDGYSIGKWDGDTFVVTTTGLRDGAWIDTGGDPLTDAATVTERFQRLNFGHMDIEITINDPRAYAKPWSFTTHEVLVPDTELLESVCAENEKDLKHMPVKTPPPGNSVPATAQLVN